MTSGSPVIDWRLADPLCDPPGVTDSHYSERLCRLPHTMWCYRPPVQHLPATELPPSVRNPNTPFTFGSFNNCSKMSEITFRLWARTVLANPGSRLLLKASAMADQSTRELILSRFAKQGLPADRIMLVSQQIDLAQHFNYYNNIDLALDTFTYNGTTTTCEALWMNTPVLTMTGEMHISRVGTSLLTNLGLPELIAKDEDDFVQKASGYAQNRDSLVNLRKGLRARMQASPLMNGPQFAREFGDAMRIMWKDWCDRQKK
jgi:predicted O-linked N-acetylglucosamine transferase (SPINDLY family)